MKKKRWIVLLSLLVVVGIIVGVVIPKVSESGGQPEKGISTPNKDNEKSNKDNEKSNKDNEKSNKDNEKVDWKKEVKRIASTAEAKNSNIALEDETVRLADKYQPTKSEVKEFADYIIKEYKARRYVSDIHNNEYMLSNIFKAAVVKNYYEKKDKAKDKAYASFANDFLENSIYKHRGMDNVNEVDYPFEKVESEMNKVVLQIQ